MGDRPLQLTDPLWLNDDPAPMPEAAIARFSEIDRSPPVGAFSARTSLPVERFSEITPQLVGLWLIKRLLPAEGLALLYGHPGCGKSFLALDMAFHVALGWDWHGRRVKRGLVVYVGAEGLAGLRNRITAFRREHQVEEMPFSLIPAPIDLQAPDADVTRLAATIRAEVQHFGGTPALIVVDTLSKTFGAGKENSDDMATYVGNCARIAAEFGCCVMPVHHRPKDAESEEPRGHGSLKGGMDTVILVEAGATKKARVTKQKDGELGDAILFSLKPIELGEDEDGEVVTSCVVMAAAIDSTPARDPILALIARLPDGPKLVFKQLEELTIAEGVPVPTSIPDAEINRLRVGKVVSLSAWRDKSILAAGTDRDMDRDTGKKAFNRALKKLQTLGIVRVWGDFAWRDRATITSPGHAGTA